MNISKQILLYCSLCIISVSWAAEKNWTKLSVEDANWSGVAVSADGIRLAIVANPSFIYTSSNSGITWTEQTGSGQRNWQSISSSTDGKILAAANQNGFIYTSSDFGVTWTEQTGSGQRNWRSIAVSSNAYRIAAVEQNGYIYTSYNYGDSWSERSAAGRRGWYGISSSADGNKLVAAEFGGYIYTSFDAGGTWTTRTASAGRQDWMSVFSSADGGKVVAVTYMGLVYISSNSGSYWTELGESEIRKWNNVVMSQDGSKIFTTVQGGAIYMQSPPFIVGINSTSKGVYHVGDSIDIDVSFSENVTSTGNITITLETGKNDAKCLLAITDKKEGTCKYVVRNGDNAEKLNVSKIQGTIRDIAGTAMSVFVPIKNLSENTSIQIDTTSVVTDVPSSSTPVICQKPGNLYRLCPPVQSVGNFSLYTSGLLCEGIIDDTLAERNRKRLSRYDVIDMAVSMNRLDLIDASNYRGSFEDVTRNMYPVVQTALDQGFISDSTMLNPSKNVTRLEAYTLLMKSVCLAPEPQVGQDWSRLVYDAASQAGITKLTWERFRPQNRASKREVFILATRLADWADKTGGCEEINVCK